MKKMMKKINIAVIGIMASMPAFAAGSTAGLCNMIQELHNVFNILRTLAFVGAAFYIAGWAWGFISSGKVDVKDVKDKGIGLLVGFLLLFSIGMVLSFVLSSTGGSVLCPNALQW